MKITKWDILLILPSVFCMCIVFASIILNYLQYTSHGNGIFDYKIWCWLISVCVLNLFVHFAFQFTKRGKIVKFLSILQSCDLQLSALKIKINHQQQRKVVECITLSVVIFVVFFFAAIIFAIQVLQISQSHVIALEFVYFYYLLYEAFFCIQLFIPTFLLCERIVLLRKHIESSKNCLNLKLIAELFHDLCDAIFKINSIFTPHLIATMTLMMIGDIFVSYQIFYYFLQYQDQTSNFFIFENGFFIISHFLLKCGISYIGHTLMVEAESIKMTIAKSFDVTNCDKKFEYLQLLAQFNTRNLKLQNVCFVIDWRVVLSVSLHACIFKFN